MYNFRIYVAIGLLSAQLVDADPLQLHVASTPSQHEVRRIGINMGSWHYWGAEQLMANIVKNPGFEGRIDRTISTVAEAGYYGFLETDASLGRDDGFWRTGHYDVRTGPAAGARGQIADSKKKGRNALPEFTTLAPIAGLGSGDIVSLTRISDRDLPSHWWFEKNAPINIGISSDIPPTSPGKRSLALRPLPNQAAAAHSYFDAIGERAGRLLPIEGTWQLSFWAKSTTNSSLQTRFRRMGSPSFLDKTTPLNADWQHYSYTFEARDTGLPNKLQLSFIHAATSGEILVDDVVLRAVADSSSAFRSTVVELLKQLQPAYLRDWAGQLGDTLENRVAHPFARRATRYRPGGRGETFYIYSLDEFLALCHEVDAAPWVIVPPTFSDAELHQLGLYLAEQNQRYGFAEILLEFGNENWNRLFRAGGISNASAHGQAFERAYAQIRAGAGSAPIQAVANAQYAYVEYAIDFARHTPSADLLALAPYILHDLDANTSSDEQLAALFADDHDRMRQLKAALPERELAIYEVNLHTTRGSASGAMRDALTASLAGGSALALNLLRSIENGASRQCVYTLAGFDSKLADREGRTRLWGIFRDLGPTKRARPTGQAVDLLNRVIADQFHAVPSNSEQAHAAAFASNIAWSAALVSTVDTPQVVDLHFPTGSTLKLPQQLVYLEADHPSATNEDAANVQIRSVSIEPSEHHTFTFTLPARTLAVLVP